MAQAYCFKCKAKREIKNAERVLLKNNGSALKGVCPVCGGRLSRIVPADVCQPLHGEIKGSKPNNLAYRQLRKLFRKAGIG